ncbi:MAG: cupin domain-containing protein [Clostridia bacterium]|nr:cupin domain-containing protein [Clostridia bacterium]
MTIQKKDMPITTLEKMRGGNGPVEMTQLLPERPERLKMFNHVRLAPGSSIGFHGHEGETEIYYFLSGNGRVRDDDMFYNVKAGDAMCTTSGHSHGVENTGSEDMEIIATIILD